ncbi:AraC-like DNA-binding protein [Paenibacillus castaneae]|uniref:helix-turn-helix transcriptional regulator n=1 Tax=Paenibacillus castaneae TaxID=474957 RepID=UPI000C9AC5B1|nr:response regulator transcription factor [Paenibacillus castaneae]NIK75430.1 AraC-like DNA-binding protein [Paenibacillus castaneae]
MIQFIAPPMPHYIVSGEDTYPVDGKHPDRSHIGVFDLIVVTRGTLHLEEDNHLYSVSEGNYIILRPDLAHRTAAPCQAETHFYWLHFQSLSRWKETTETLSLSLPQTDHAYPQIETFSFYISRFGELRSLGLISEQLEKLIQLQHEQTTSALWRRQIIFQDLMLLLQDEEGEQHKSPHLIVAEEAAFLLRKYYKEPISYKRLSEALHFHENYISLCMKKTFGCTPLEFLNRHRVEQAKQMLIHTNEPIGNIAEESGFGSFPYFVRCFNRYTGSTPKSFRQQYRS